MRKLSLEQVREIQLNILDFVSNFCETNEIRYWIDCGTLLGAVRHKGYIPWDDDIDIGMLREDYERFARLFNQQTSQYRFVCIENTPNLFVPHGKVLDTKTVLFEPDEAGFETSVNIDVFVYDSAPDNDAVLNEMFDKRDKLRRIFLMQNQTVANEKCLFRKIAKIIRRMCYRLCFPRDGIQQIALNAKRFARCETERVGNFSAFARMVCHKRVFDAFVDVEFEGKKFKAPIGYDEWLRSFYGEYMILPPREKQVTHHRYVAYMRE